MKKIILYLSALAIIFLLTTIHSCKHDPFFDPDTLNDGMPTTPGCSTEGEICFERSVLPIFISACARSGCHDIISGKSGYILDTYPHILRGGIDPWDAENSKIYEVLFEKGSDQMPPDEPLTQAQTDSIKAWIDQGAKNTVNCDCYCDSTNFNYASSIEVILANACAGCHKPGSLEGNVNLAGYDNVKVQVMNGGLLGSIAHNAGFSPMPPGMKLSDCEIQKVKDWIDSGAPSN